MLDKDLKKIFAIISSIAIVLLILYGINCDKEEPDNSDESHDSNGSYDSEAYNSKSYYDKQGNNCGVTKCLCTGGGGKLCANKCVLVNSYLKGNTEYQDLAAVQKKVGGPFWKTTTYGSY